MIVRILSEDQYDLPGKYIDELNSIDNELVELVEEGKVTDFTPKLEKMLSLVRKNGTLIPVDELVESDLVLPNSDISFDEATSLFKGEGLIPG
ncbi:MAG: hypothetical protein FI718_07330 [SAR202 cluster bacterium]|nr:hypothetical protein [SAR202 cluster bacterium]|tara:strand:+ start:3116 stop:3394 length:279 start_codon:yes stop_codon:yes gene_type:complete